MHLWLGLIAGSVLTVISLSGSLLVFRHELERLLNASIWQVEVPADSAHWQPASKLAEAAQAALPVGAKTGWVEFPLERTEALQLTYQLPAQGIDLTSDSFSLFINPYTAEVIGSRLSEPAANLLATPLVPLLFKLHYGLLLGRGGEVFVGMVATGLLISVLSGLFLWWPQIGNWRRAFGIKRRASIERRNFDIHKSVGVYTSLILLVLLFSGVSMNLPEQFNNLLQVFSPLHLPKQAHSTPTAGQAMITWGQAAQVAEVNYPEGRLGWLITPNGNDGIYQVCKTDIPSLNRFVGYRCIWIDQYNGNILEVIDQKTGSHGDIFLQWQWPLHSGRAFGTTGRILVFLTGLSCPVLYLTGVIRWLQKRRAAKLHQAKQLPAYESH